MLNQMPDFNLKVVGISVDRCRPGLRAFAGRVEPAGLFGPDLKFGDVKRVMRAVHQPRIHCTTAVVGLRKPNGNRLGNLLASLACPVGIQIAVVYLPVPVDQLIGQPCIGRACAMLINQLKAGVATRVWAPGFEHPCFLNKEGTLLNKVSPRTKD